MIIMIYLLCFSSHMTYASHFLEKFSRHLIFRIPQRAFKDNGHVGAFVSEVPLNLLVIQ